MIPANAAAILLIEARYSARGPFGNIGEQALGGLLSLEAVVRRPCRKWQQSPRYRRSLIGW